MYARDDIAAAEQWQQLPSGEHVRAATEAFRMLSDSTRVRLLWLMCGAEHDVATLAARVGVARPAVSQHLAKLRLAGLVTLRKEGRRALYRARGGHVRRLLAEAVEAADHRLTGTEEHD
ncbi:DNA-binding transcriptional ArsR family regulator [Actinopolyspora biskrensis]|uniref:DNA-binding transcriptional ArsR family regulator n=1 Tax=Actinopolyspora biskrensis TaxID=1470178 RepID=A0A852ZDE2_9ACTN|nr:metalloregulator ArsR/SmtB family transcription factor [Actinopolyspora biskrensis]NYH80013.1 DNA-binding transcriptional ArsR family regulator [Actinopolyspora biskrensis]